MVYSSWFIVRGFLKNYKLQTTNYELWTNSHLIGARKDSIPADAFEDAAVFCGKPDEKRLADDMVLRHKTPKARIFRVVAVIAHHPVIILLEGVAGSFLAIY